LIDLLSSAMGIFENKKQKIREKIKTRTDFEKKIL